MVKRDDISLLDEAANGDLELVGLTVKQYDFMIEQGLLNEDTSTELINGFIVKKDRSASGEAPMTIGDRHRTAILRLSKLDRQFELVNSFIQPQQPISLPPESELEPDLAVVKGTIDDFIDRKPGVADLLSVIEVADSSLRRDLGVKLQMYAQAGVPEYVVVNLVNNVVLVYHDPLRGEYQSVQTLRAGEMLKISGGLNQTVEIAVAKLL